VAFISSALACGDSVEGALFGFHPHVGIAGEHGARDVPAYDGQARLTAATPPRSRGRKRVRFWRGNCRHQVLAFVGEFFVGAPLVMGRYP